MVNQENYELWQQRIKEQKASGLTILVWCQQNQLSPHAYDYWRKIINEQLKTKEETPSFVEVPKNNSINTSSSSIVLTWKELKIELSSRQDILMVVDLIHALQTTC